MKTKGKSMNTLLFILLIGLAGGIAVGLQGPLASIITQRMGMMESAFIVHFGGAVAALIPLIFIGGGKLGLWKSLPWYALFTGVLGLVVLSAVSYAIPRIGVAGAITSIVTGQILISALLDHFGWLGADVRPLDGTRLLGLAIVMLGVWLTVK
ncbi:MAG: DMT family transporter [Anaerolineaceae bacterium]|nr:MAG: DMT family transporter [Anaerolineaceae bacterium]